MQTLTINVDESYLDQLLNFLQNIPKNKREIFHHQKLDISVNRKNVNNDFLLLLENGPTISNTDVNEWENNIKNGYKSWKIEEL
jgi:hypothetical protein